MIEPVFANTKFNRRYDRFLRRGRSACRSEWRLINATHNLLKLYKHTTGPLPAYSARERVPAARAAPSAARKPTTTPPSHTKLRNSHREKERFRGRCNPA
jgi:hypothetical protein